ncbi:unnamed protein product [Symbiodinium sp. CCMP2456]|nr:unnamed protein product [Symbiodinium sp. CCMP2456]
MTLDELNCSEFLEALRTILTPAMASKSVGSYARAEINLTQVLHHCLKMADTNRDGTLSFQEFERFLKNLRKPKHPTELALLYMNMFDADPDAYIAENEFRDMWRYFMGRNPRSDEFQFHWSRMDTARAGRISQRALARWLAKTAPKAFTTLAPPVIESEGTGRKRKILVQAVCNRNLAFHVATVYLKLEDMLRKKVRRLSISESKMLIAIAEKAAHQLPVPSMVLGFAVQNLQAGSWTLAPAVHTLVSCGDVAPDTTFMVRPVSACQDPCDQNIAWRGCQTSNEVLNDDYQQGYLFKAKQKTSWHGSVVTTAVDILPGDKAPMTPAKITWRLPTPLGCPFVVIDKLEMDKKGGIKLEGSTEKALKGLRIELKPELSDVMKTKTGLIYSGLKDARLGLDLKGIGVQDAVADVRPNKAELPELCAQIRVQMQCAENAYRLDQIENRTPSLAAKFEGMQKLKRKAMKITASCCVDWCSGVDLAPSNRRAWQDSGISAGAVDEVDLAHGAMVRGFDLQNLATDCFQLGGIASKTLNCLQYRSQVVFLAWVFAPFMCASTLLVVFGKESRTWREYWLHQLLECTQRAGAAFQKFGQWLSMRPDMFPPDVILVLSKLRADAPAHSGVVSRRMLKVQLGKDVDELFDEFQEEPVASGSVGQVHRARLRAEHALDGPGGQLRDVAVKIQHPGVIDSAFMDLNIVWKLVEFSEKFLHMTMPFDRSDFDEVIQAQMDFTREAFNLQRFARNFKGEHRIRFPKVSSHFVTPEVLVETWENGEIISNIMEDFDNAKAACQDAMTALESKKREVQGDLSRILYDMSMKMMIRDNFVHGDLHGGNILYSTNDDHVTVLDAGIATSLDKRTVAPFGRFLHALCSGQTEKVVEYLQRFDESKMVVNTKQLHADIQETMDKYMGPFRIDKEGPVNAADMFGEVMFTLQRHGMLLKGDVASTLFTISISEGQKTFFSRPESLPELRSCVPAAPSAGMAAPARWSLLLLLLSVLANKVAGQVADEADVDEDGEDDEDFPESVKTLTDSTFQDFIKSNERVLVEFYAPWCGHCQQLEPQYNQAADALRMEGAKTMLAKVDATAETGLAGQYQVQSYPTLKYFVGGGEPVDYDGPREADGIAEWLRKREKPAVEEMKESEVKAWIQKTLDENAFALVAHVKKKSARAKAYAKSAESLIDYKGSKLRFAVVWLPKAADPKKDAYLSMSRPLKDPEDKKLEFPGSWTDTGLAKWIKQSTYALVGDSFAADKYSTEAMQEIGAKGAVIGIFDTEDAGKDMRSLLQKVAVAEASWRFATSPRSKLEESDVAVLGAKTDAPMQISVLYQEKKYVLKDVTEQAIKSFLADILAKKAKPYYKSAAPPSQAAEGGVTVLTGDTFDEVVLNAKHDVFVEFYAPWCGHCKKLEPVWTQLAQKMESLGHAKNVVVAKMDATENECEEQVTGYPTLVFYPAVKKEKKFRQKLIYQGARDFDPLLDFLVENAVNLEGVELTEGVGKQASLVDRERARKKKKAGALSAEMEAGTDPRFYATHRGFQAHKRRLKMPEEPPRRPVLSQESHQFMSQPGWERHEKNVLNVNGEVAAWRENTPRALQKQVREPGTTLLRVPLPPAPHLIHGRFPRVEQ